jgi:lipopolysaccharide cholinephosphotransferase
MTISNEDVTKKLQETEKEIYKDFQALCKKHNIPFFASGGTAIGAIRHQGFIPWDDDIDICLLREDYNKVIYYIRKELSDKYEVYDCKSKDGYVLVFSKICKKGTKIQEDTYADTNYTTGVFVDLFAYDRTSRNPKLRRKQIRDTWLWARLMVLSVYKHPRFPDNLNGIKLKAAKGICILVHYGLKILHLNKNFFYKKYLKAALRYKDSKEELYTDFSYIAPEKLLCTHKMIFPLKEVKFEDCTISILNNADKYLKSQFGDYLTLPPINQRKTHNPKYVDFGDGTIYVKRKRG